MVTRRVGRLIEEQTRPTSRTNPVYGRVFFALRRRFGLSVSACLLADVIETLSLRTGWCFASPEYLAGLLGVSVRTVQRLLVDLDARGLIERDGRNGRQVRPTERWRDARVSPEPRQNGVDI